LSKRQNTVVEPVSLYVSSSIQWPRISVVFFFAANVSTLISPTLSYMSELALGLELCCVDCIPQGTASETDIAKITDELQRNMSKLFVFDEV